MGAIPKDPVMLLSYVNTQLRDNYDSLEEMCRALDADETKILSALSSIGYQYERTANCFR